MYGFGVASLAVDGDTNGHWLQGRSCSHSDGEFRPWWAVDLGSSTSVLDVEITNRMDAVTGTPQLVCAELVCKVRGSMDFAEYVPESNEQTSPNCSGFAGFSAI